MVRSLNWCVYRASRTPSSSPASFGIKLLSRSHPEGRTKARFFTRLGYGRDQWHLLASDLRRLAEDVEATEAGTTEYGTKFEIRDQIEGPSGEERVVTIWIILVDEDFPRFVTACPE